MKINENSVNKSVGNTWRGATSISDSFFCFVLFARKDNDEKGKGDK